MPLEGAADGRLAETVLPFEMFFASAEEAWTVVTLLVLVPGAVLATVLL